LSKKQGLLETKKEAELQAAAALIEISRSAPIFKPEQTLPIQAFSSTTMRSKF